MNRLQMKLIVVIMSLLGSNLMNLADISSDPQSCTIVSWGLEDTILFGNNEDYTMKGTGFWFTPSENGYGAVIFGYLGNWHPADKFAQGGMNDQGLCCDANALSRDRLHPNRSLPRAPLDFFGQILEECATVNETIDWFESHHFGNGASGQYHFTDAMGDAVVIHVGNDQQWNFTRKSRNPHLISTNFNLNDVKNRATSDWRYEAADTHLSKYDNVNNITVENLKEVMAATKQDTTQYTNIFNPQTLDIYIWYKGNFSTNVQYNLADELDGLEKTKYIKIPVLFGQPDRFFPPQFPIFVALGLGIVAIPSIWIGRRIYKHRKQKHKSVS